MALSTPPHPSSLPSPYRQPPRGAARVAPAVPRAPRRPARMPSATVAALLLATITAAAAFLRLWHGDAQSLRLDEGFSMRWASWPLAPVYHGKTLYQPSLFQATAADEHPPAYLLLLHYWMHAFGTNLATLRLPSELTGTLAVPALYLLAASLYGRVVGLFAALLGALSPFWIWHAQEVRMYPFLLLFTILSTYGLVQALEYKRRWGWVVLFAFSLLAIYTHYYAFLMIFAQVLFVLAHWRHYGARRVVIWLGTMALVAVAFIPWLLVLLAHRQGVHDPDLAEPTIYTPFILLIEFLLGYLTTPITSALLAMWPLLVPAALALSVFASAMTRRGSLAWLLFLTPIVMAFTISALVHPFVAERYLVVSTPALYTILGIVFARLRGRIPRAAIVACAAVLLLSCWRVEETSAANPLREDYRAPASYIESHIQPGDIVAIDSGYNEDAFTYYSHLNVPVYELPLQPSDLATTTGKPAAFATAVDRYLGGIEAGNRRLWVVYYLEGNYDPTDRVRHRLAYGTASHKVIYGGPYKRDDPHYPGSYTSVQLVLYNLIPRRAAVEYVRPITVQETRALTGVSPTLREPYAAPFGQSGARAPLIGHLLAPPAPAKAWHFPALPSTGEETRLTLFNPNPFATTAAVEATGIRGATGARHHVVRLPPRANVEVRLAVWGATRTAALSVTSSSVIVPQRSSMGKVAYGLAGTLRGAIGRATSQRGRTAIRPDSCPTRPDSCPTRSDGTAIVAVDVLRVRARPSTQAPIVGLVRRGDRLHLLWRGLRWSEVSGQGSVRGWVSSPYLTQPR